MQLLGVMIDRTAIAKLESGRRPVTDIEIAAISKVLEVDILLMFENKDNILGNLTKISSINKCQEHDKEKLRPLPTGVHQKNQILRLNSSSKVLPIVTPSPLFHVGNNLETPSNPDEEDKQTNNKAYQQSLSNILLFKNKKQYCSKQRQQHIIRLEYK